MQDAKLKHLFGNSFAIATLVGGIIGLGILRTPGEIAEVVTDPSQYLMFWLFGGLFSLLTLAVIGELVAMTARSGGPYTLVARAYGPYAGFLIGWVDWLTFPAVLALKAVVVVEFAALLYPPLAAYITPGAILVTTLFALIQLMGGATGGSIQRAAAVGIACIAAATAIALIYGGMTNTVPMSLASDEQHEVGGSLAVVIAAIIFTYDGSLYASYFGGEIKGGGRAAAVSAIKGLVIVTSLYLVMNAALVVAVPLQLLAGEELAFASAMDLLFGVGAGSLIIVGAILTLLSQQNLSYMSGSRVLFALSVDGLASDRANKVDERGTPIGALLPTWVLAVLLIILGGFNFLLNLSVLLYVLIYASLVYGVFRLRKQEPETPRPFRAFLHPFSSALVLLGWIAFGMYIATSDPMTAVNTVALVALSLPTYYLLMHLKRKPSVADSYR
ncbi:MAG TPA: APC family permease [Porticoccus sp.]|nr:APC family permease [Porticoccus sp.]